MTYANILIHVGINNFCIFCKKNGISGIIIPDLPHDSEECKILRGCAIKVRIHIIYVISPAIEDKRLKEIKRLASGFIYCTSRQGTTGTGKEFAQNISSYLVRARKASSIPLAVGFGISSSKDSMMFVQTLASRTSVRILRAILSRSSARFGASP